MRHKLAIKLIVLIVLSVTLMVCIMAPLYFYLQPTMYIKQELRIVATFSENLKNVEPFDREHLDEFVTESKENYRVYVFDKDFEPLYTSYEFGNNTKFLKQLFGNKLTNFSEDATPYYVDIDNDPSVRLYTCCEKNGKTYYIYIKDSHSGVAQVFAFSNRVLTFVVIGYIIICSIVLILVISPSIKRIKQVTDVAVKISENNFSVRYQGKILKNEIGDLALSVNKMADTMQKNIDNLENYNFVLYEDNQHMKEYELSRRILLRNITHDLKTPLAVISSQVEMIATCQKQQDKDYYYNSAMEEITKMSKMISEVLKMTGDERRVASKKASNINISALITELCDSSSAYIKSRKLKLQTDITHDLHLVNVKEYVEFVFRNYMSNAVQNAQTDSPITVTLKKHGKFIRLSVENFGEHISEQMKDKIWSEGFTTKPQGKENTGLGLYIVKEISLKEDTKCGFENTENGVRFWFDFNDYSDNTKEESDINP